MVFDLKAYIDKLITKCDLSPDEIKEIMDAVAKGEVDQNQIAAFLVLLRAKGETPEEVAAIVEIMLKHSINPMTSSEVPLLDIVGTGGDGHDTVNISTTAAILAAACGARVGKHGNRSVSSRSGSADVLEVLGCPMLKPEDIESCLTRCGIAFMYAPHFHPAMRHVKPVRTALKVRTIFNILGPLLNPIRAAHMFVGVYTPELVELMAQVMLRSGVEHGLVVHCCGLDELAPLGPAVAMEVRRGKGVSPITIDPAAMGIPPCTLEDLKGGSAQDNADIIQRLLSGGKQEGQEQAAGPLAHTVALNAGAGLYVYGMADSVEAGYRTALAKLQSGAAMETLSNWATTSQELYTARELAWL